MTGSSGVMRKCKECGGAKTLTAAFESVTNRNGSKSWYRTCRGCRATRRRERRRANIETAQIKERSYAAENREKINAMSRASYARRREAIRKAWKNNYDSNPGKFQAANKILSKRYRARHPERVRLAAKKWHARKRSARVETITHGQILELRRKQRGRCAVCLKKLARWHIDHIHPLAKGGPHAIGNLQLLCPPCNLKKNASHPIDFMQKLGFLL